MGLGARKSLEAGAPFGAGNPATRSPRSQPPGRAASQLRQQLAGSCWTAITPVGSPRPIEFHRLERPVGLARLRQARGHRAANSREAVGEIVVTRRLWYSALVARPEERLLPGCEMKAPRDAQETEDK